VGASVIGGIELHGLARREWVGPKPFAIDRVVDKGDELGHFRFGSTVVLLLPKELVHGALPVVGRDVRMGEGLLPS
jgi:hypothetical protein